MTTKEENIQRFQAIADRGLQDKLSEDNRAKFDELVKRGFINGEGSPTVQKEVTQPVSQKEHYVPKEGRMSWFEALKDSFSPEAHLAALSKFKLPSKERPFAMIQHKPYQRMELKGELKGMNEVGPRDLPMKGLLATLMIPDVKERAVALDKQGHKIDYVHGVPVVTLKNGKRKMLNKPGWSMGDAATLGAEMLKFTGAGKAVRMVKGKSKKMLLGALGHGITSDIDQRAQEGLGGAYDPTDVVLTTLVGGGAEALIPLLGKIHRQLSPQTKAAFKNAKTIEEIQKVTGWSEEELLETVRTNLGKNATPVEAGVPLSKEKLLTAALNDPKKARALQEQYVKEIDGARGKYGRTLSALTDTDIVDAVAGAKRAAGGIMDAQIKDRKILADKLYGEALNDVGIIDTEKYVNHILVALKKDANPGDPTEKGLIAYLNQFESRAYKEAVKANKNIPQALDPNGVPIPHSLPPRWEKDANLFHNIIIDMRARSALASSETTTPGLKTQLARLEKMMVDDLDKLSGGQFKIANAEYARMTAELDKLAKGHPGKASKLEDLQIGEFLESIFEQRKIGDKEIAEKFMRDLTKRDPKSANDLYGSYFLAKIKDLDGTAKSFNSALFEKGAKLEANPIFKFAPNPEAKKRIRELHATFKKAEAFEQLGLVKNADGKWVAQKMDTEMSHIIYVRQALSRAVGKGQRKRMGEAWFEFATNPKWAEDWDRIIQGRKRMMSTWPKGKLYKPESASEYANATKAAFKDIDEVTTRIVNSLTESDWLAGVRPGATVAAANEIKSSPQAPVDQSEPIQLRNNNSSISSQTQKDIDRYVEQGIAEQQN